MENTWIFMTVLLGVRKSHLKLFLDIWFSFHPWESSRSRLCTKGRGLLEDKLIGLLPRRTRHAAPPTLCIVSVPESRGHDNGVVWPGDFRLWAQNCQMQKFFLLICPHFFVLGPSNLLQMRVWDGPCNRRMDRKDARVKQLHLCVFWLSEGLGLLRGRRRPGN